MTHYAVHAALTTPFGDDGWVDLDALHLHLGLLMDDGVHGIVAAGTTGEGALLEESEVATVVASAVQAAEGRIEVIAHVGRASTPATTRLARAAAGSGADAVMAITPWFFRHDHEALLAHYRAVLASVEGTPVLAYNFPNRTGNDLSPELVDTLAGEGLAGLKDSTGSPERHAEYLDVAHAHDGFRLFVGSERLVRQSLEGKGAGSISALANVQAPRPAATRRRGLGRRRRPRSIGRRHRRPTFPRSSGPWPSGWSSSAPRTRWPRGSLSAAERCAPSTSARPSSRSTCSSGSPPRRTARCSWSRAPIARAGAAASCAAAGGRARRAARHRDDPARRRERRAGARGDRGRRARGGPDLRLRRADRRSRCCPARACSTCTRRCCRAGAARPRSSARSRPATRRPA